MQKTGRSVLMVLIALLGAGSSLYAKNIQHYFDLEKSIECPSNESEEQWCETLKQELKGSKRRIAAGVPDALSEFKRSLGKLLVEVSFSQVAIERDEVILFRPVTQAAYEYIVDGFPTKNIHVKGKTAKFGPHRGLIPFRQKFSKLSQIKNVQCRLSQIFRFNRLNKQAIALGYAETLPLIESNCVVVYRFGKAICAQEPEAEDEILEVMSSPSNQKYFTADVDVLVFGRRTDIEEPYDDPELGTVTKSEVETIEALNKAFRVNGYTGGNIVQHGAEARFEKSEGLDYPITAFEPDGRRWTIPKCGDFFDQDCFLRAYYKRVELLGFNLHVNPMWDWPKENS